jgi:hypothetical protein
VKIRLARGKGTQNFPEKELVTARFPDMLNGSKQEKAKEKIYGTHL